MSKNPLVQLTELGQSIWLDDLRRGMITGGQLKSLIDNDALRGITSNPAIFEKAITGSKDYDDAIASLARAGKSPEQIYEALTVEDVQRAADCFRPVFDRTEGGDGFVSLEVSPYLARDTQGTLVEARRLWSALARPNVFIKVPGTREGLAAVEQLIAEGININITLLFGLPRYRQVAESYIIGLEKRAAAGKPVANIASVASFFLSRIDTLIDPQLEAKVKAGSADAKNLVGEAAIASAKVSYTIYDEAFNSPRFAKLEKLGARRQRLLWASTSTKNPAYSDVKYVEPLIGRDTVNTLPMETLIAYRDHGKPELRLEDDVAKAKQTLTNLSKVGIDIDRVTQQLEDEGIDKFVKPFDQLIRSIAERSKSLR